MLVKLLNLGLDQEYPPSELNKASIAIIQLVDLQILCGCTQAIKEEMVYKQGQLKLTHTNFAILNSHIYIFKIILKTFILCGKTKKVKNSCWLFSSKNTVTIKWHLLQHLS